MADNECITATAAWKELERALTEAWAQYFVGSDGNLRAGVLALVAVHEFVRTVKPEGSTLALPLAVLADALMDRLEGTPAPLLEFTPIAANRHRHGSGRRRIKLAATVAITLLHENGAHSLERAIHIVANLLERCGIAADRKRPMRPITVQKWREKIMADERETYDLLLGKERADIIAPELSAAEIQALTLKGLILAILLSGEINISGNPDPDLLNLFNRVQRLSRRLPAAP